MSGEPADETAAIAAMRSELGRIREGVGRIERGLVEIERCAATRPIRPRSERYFSVLLAVYEHGRHGMGSEAFGALGVEHGYDRRGLGGFFTGLAQRSDRTMAESCSPPRASGCSITTSIP